MAWQSMETAPTGWYNFFLIRPVGLHPKYEKPYIPSVVQQIETKFFAVDDEITSVFFGNAELEWHELPE